MLTIPGTLVLVVAMAGAPAPPQGKPAAPPAAQQPAAKPGAPAAPPPADPAPPPPSYSYNPENRRDPFVSLLAASDPRSAAVRPPGVAGMLISEVRVKGILRDRTGFIAMIQGPETKTFTVRAGEKLFDGSIKAITADSVVFSQDVNDPLSVVKQREVRVLVRPDGRG
jgi:Tfp pilus assembly protein PilP